MITQIIILVWLHFVADFVLQSDTMALNKSKCNFWLAVHSVVYAMPFFVYSYIVGAPQNIAVIIWISHAVIDFITSRVEVFLWKRNRRRSFLNTIGLDQAIHLTILVVMYGNCSI